jgi:CheY-like chemotaxis protein
LTASECVRNEPDGRNWIAAEGRMKTGIPRLLLVEDDADNAEALEVMLGYWGYEVEVARNRASALGRAALRQPDAVVIDLGLPTFEEGCALLKELRGMVGGDRPLVVAVTGHSGDNHRRQAIEAGCDFFFVKPADLDELQGALGTIGAREALNRK